MAKKTKGFSDIYIQFLELASALQTLPTDDSLDAIDNQILGELVLHWKKNTPLQVNEAIHLEHIASPATLHKRIKKLRDLGFLEAEKHATEFRIKVLVPTEIALKHYSRLGSLLMKVAKSNA